MKQFAVTYEHPVKNKTGRTLRKAFVYSWAHVIGLTDCGWYALVRVRSLPNVYAVPLRQSGTEDEVRGAVRGRAASGVRVIRVSQRDVTWSAGDLDRLPKAVRARAVSEEQGPENFRSSVWRLGPYIQQESEIYLGPNLDGRI